MDPTPKPVHIYNPDDEGDQHAFNGTHFDLAPNQTTDIAPLVEAAREGAGERWVGLTAEHAADHIVAQLGRFGVCRTRGRVRRREGGGWFFEDPDDEPTVRAAELLYDTATRAWAHELSLAYHRVAKPHIDAGLPPPKPTDQEQKALSWLAAHPTPPAVDPLA